jgi:hypothetical protein
LLLALIAPGTAWAGPPYDTDDPEPADPGHWEIFAFTAAEGRHDWEGEAGVDINYGLAPDLQLTVTLPVDAEKAGHFRAGRGDAELGVKYRFFHREDAGIQLSIFPTATLPTASRSFGSESATFFLPVWAQKDFGKWSLFGGGGITLNPGHGNRNFWQGGVALTREITPRLTLGVEATRSGPEADGGRPASTLGLGAVYRLKGPFSLLASAGPKFEQGGGTSFHAYAALAMNF